MEKQRLFVDMDGTLAVFQKLDTLEALYEKGYFLNLKPIPNVVNAIKNIISGYPDIEVHILSAVLTDSRYSLDEKNAWLDKYLPEVDKEHRIFTACGQDKKQYVSIKENDFLLDDYTHNLELWQPPARGIKLLNGINHTKGTWQHDCLRWDKSPSELTKNIAEIMRGKVNIRDSKPDMEIMEKKEGQAHLLNDKWRESYEALIQNEEDYPEEESER